MLKMALFSTCGWILFVGWFDLVFYAIFSKLLFLEMADTCIIGDLGYPGR